MTRRRMYLGATASWFHPSQVFSDTQKVDLFSDPPWETSSDPSPRRPQNGRSGLSKMKTLGLRRMLSKRGQHRRTFA